MTAPLSLASLHPAPDPRPELIRIEGLNKHYGAFHVLHDIDLSVREGERIVLFSDKQDAEPGPLIEWAHAQGAPEIAVPKKVVPLREIPVLGTGKTDYIALQRLAEETLAEAA